MANRSDYGDLMGSGYSRSPMTGQGSIAQRLGNVGQQPTIQANAAPAPAAPVRQVPAQRFNQAQAGPMYGDSDMSALDIYKPNPQSSYKPSLLDVQDRATRYGIPADMSQKWYDTNYPAPVQAQEPAYDEAAARQRLGTGGIMIGR